MCISVPRPLNAFQTTLAASISGLLFASVALAEPPAASGSSEPHTDVVVESIPVASQPTPSEQTTTPLPAEPAIAARDEVAVPDSPPSEPASEAAADSPPFVLSGYAEVAYSWNFNNPANGITNFRGFDNRHNTFTLSNVVLDAQWDYSNVVGRVALQVGHTPSTYYLAEPTSAGTSGASASGAELWKYVQQANVGYRFPIGNGLLFSAGLYLSPIGPEGMAVRDNWNWSRSNLFFGLPFYHTGVRASYSVNDELSLTAAVYNGWNSVVDNNDAKSLSLQATWTNDTVVVSALYFAGSERSNDAIEGKALRHLVDAHVTWNVNSKLSLLAHGNVGFEPGRFGLSHWLAFAGYARYAVLPWISVALRGDVFFEHVGANDTGTASPIFWPASWVSSGTATVDFHPADKVSFRVEYRHDHAAADMFFARDVAVMEAGPIPNRSYQDTLTFGATAGF